MSKFITLKMYLQDVANMEKTVIINVDSITRVEMMQIGKDETVSIFQKDNSITQVKNTLEEVSRLLQSQSIEEYESIIKAYANQRTM